MNNLELEQVLNLGIKGKIIVMDVEDGRFFKYGFINQEATDLIKFDKSIYGKKIMDIYPNEHGVFLYAQYQKVLQTKQVHTYEEMYQDKKGRYIEARTRLTPIIDEHGVCHKIVAMITDKVSEKTVGNDDIEKWQKMKAETARYEALFQHNLDAILLMSADGCIRGGNETTAQITGYELAELNGLNLCDIMADQQCNWKGHFEEALNDKIEDFSMNLRHKNGRVKRVLLKFVPVIIEDNIQSVYGIIKDVTQIAESASALRKSEKQLEIITENMVDFVMLFNRQGQMLYASPSYQRFLGLKIDDLNINTFYKNVIDEDKDIAEKAFNEMLKNGLESKIQYRQKNNLGEIVWCESKSVIVRNQTGKVDYSIVFTRDITKELKHQKILEHAANHDFLTGLPNRKYFYEEMEKALEAYEQAGHFQTAIMMIDIDDFKDINDIYGHDIGDMVIQEFGKRLKTVIRQGDVIARLGGDEFVILLPKINHKKNAVEIAKRIQTVMREPWDILSDKTVITTSKGIALAYPGVNVKKLMKDADVALYHTKEKGKDAFVLVE